MNADQRLGEECLGWAHLIANFRLLLIYKSCVQCSLDVGTYRGLVFVWTESTISTPNAFPHRWLCNMSRPNCNLHFYCFIDRFINYYIQVPHIHLGLLLPSRNLSLLFLPCQLLQNIYKKAGLPLAVFWVCSIKIISKLKHISEYIQLFNTYSFTNPPQQSIIKPLKGCKSYFTQPSSTSPPLPSPYQTLPILKLLLPNTATSPPMRVFIVTQGSYLACQQPPTR